MGEKGAHFKGWHGDSGPVYAASASSGVTGRGQEMKGGTDTGAVTRSARGGGAGTRAARGGAHREWEVSGHAGREHGAPHSPPSMGRETWLPRTLGTGTGQCHREFRLGRGQMMHVHGISHPRGCFREGQHSTLGLYLVDQRADAMGDVHAELCAVLEKLARALCPAYACGGATSECAVTDGRRGVSWGMKEQHCGMRTVTHPVSMSVPAGSVVPCDRKEINLGIEKMRSLPEKESWGRQSVSEYAIKVGQL